MKKELTKIAITAAMVLAFGSSGQAANIGTGYTQNFDSMGTTGTTLRRCAEALREGGADEVRVLTLFRAL